jgi:hypothetical protein
VRGATVRGGLQRGRGKNEKGVTASSAAGLGAERRGGTGDQGRADARTERRTTYQFFLVLQSF